MKIAIVYNRESQAVINLFGVPNREKYGMETILKIKNALIKGGHQVKTFEGDKNIIQKLEDFMPSVISGERPGLVFNLSYGIQGSGRYMHIPGILEMLGIPYVGSGPETHAMALDKVVTKMILLQKGLPTPKFAVLENPQQEMKEKLRYPLIIKPKDEAVSFGIRVVNSEEELRQGAQIIYDAFNTATLVEEYIEGREVNVGLLGNNPTVALEPVELKFGEGPQIYTYEDKTSPTGKRIEKVCPAPLSTEQSEKIKKIAIDAFKALDCFDSARVDFRIDKDGNPYILELNSMASLGETGSYVFAADKCGLDYNLLINKLIEVASQRYFKATATAKLNDISSTDSEIFDYITQNRDKLENQLKSWTNMPTWTSDPVGLSVILRKLEKRLNRLGLSKNEEDVDNRSCWLWESANKLDGGTLIVVPLDIPGTKKGFPVSFRKAQEWLYGEGVASTRSGLMCTLGALDALTKVNEIGNKKIGVFFYGDEGRDMRYSNSWLRKISKRAKNVIVMHPGYKAGKIVDQRRGVMKYSMSMEGDPHRIGKQKLDVLTYFLQKADKVVELSKPEKKLTVALTDIEPESYSVLLPHSVKATFTVTFIDENMANIVDFKIKETLKSDKKIRTYVERIAYRPPFLQNGHSNDISVKLKKLSEKWKLPFGVESSLLTSPAGELASPNSSICGFAPYGKDLYTPNEAVHRGEFLQRTLLLALFLLEQ
ncbi:ATP-grasp domain-containing protein [Proteinivorax hydrogeniformans]|uniref:ATP-grasp domain-containing protein n=1 Tax=Proteinivorax hydrogeniformans TaxID=1826727 RepID=A0AAU8HSN9_9FIRM